MVAQDAKIRGDRYSPILRERKKLFQLPKDIKDKVGAVAVAQEEEAPKKKEK